MRFMTTILLFILSASLVRAQIPKKYCASFQPSATLRITYGNHTVEDGEELPPSVCKHPPTPSIILPPYSHEISRRGIIIVCVDPDSRPHTEVTHWIHSGWHNHSGHLESNSTAEQVYSPPVPPTATEAGWHRYIFLAFAQPELRTRLVDIPSDGECDLQKWTKANGLGMPFAGTYFKTGNAASWTNTSEGKNYSPTPVPEVRIIYSDPPESTTAEDVIPLIKCWIFAVAVVLAACFGM